jgi:WS/DGAT/MGAT family acyltransferase
METPTLHMHTLKVAILEPSPADSHPTPLTVEALREELGRRLHLLPPFRRRIVEVPLGFHHPVWIEDPDFDIDYHVRRAPVPAPGTRGEMDRVIGDIASWPLDRSRPLWQMYVLDGVADGRIGVLIKIHHAAADGVAATQLLANAMTTNMGETEPPPPARPWRPEPIPTPASLVVDAFLDHLRQLAALPRLARTTGVKLWSLGRHTRTREVSTPRPILDVPVTPFNHSLTPHRSFATTSLALGDGKEVSRAFDVSLNDVVLSVVGGALRRYLLDSGDLPDRPLVAGVPVSTDRPDEIGRLGGNRVSNLFTSLATDEPDPARRLRRIHDVTVEAKQVQNLLGAEMMQSWVQYTPPGPYSWFMREYSRRRMADRHPPPINVIVSNVPGPREPLYAAGARLHALYSVGPVLEGVGLNITLWSYLDQLEVGILGCREAVPHPERIGDLLHESIDEHVAVARTGLAATV